MKSYTVEVMIKRLPNGEGLPLPAYGTAGAACMDLCAAIGEASVAIDPGKRALIPCGFALALPSGYEAQVRPRSGLALKSGITVLNSPGTIDEDYRGEVAVILVNYSDRTFFVNRGDRIAQMGIREVPTIVWKLMDSLDGTERGEGGYGSTGV
jgi:dUTP pyrophosphatase